MSPNVNWLSLIICHNINIRNCDECRLYSFPVYAALLRERSYRNKWQYTWKLAPRSHACQCVPGGRCENTEHQMTLWWRVMKIISQVCFDALITCRSMMIFKYSKAPARWYWYLHPAIENTALITFPVLLSKYFSYFDFNHRRFYEMRISILNSSMQTHKITFILDGAYYRFHHDVISSVMIAINIIMSMPPFQFNKIMRSSNHLSSMSLIEYLYQSGDWAIGRAALHVMRLYCFLQAYGFRFSIQANGPPLAVSGLTLLFVKYWECFSTSQLPANYGKVRAGLTAFWEEEMTDAAYEADVIASNAKGRFWVIATGISWTATSLKISLYWARRNE